MELTVQELLALPHSQLHWLEGKLAHAVALNLEAKVAGNFNGPDDALFAPHTAFAQAAWRCNLQQSVARLWVEKLASLTRKAEREIGHIHKGAPLFNTGISYFISGDYARATQYIAAAADENERRDPGSGITLLTGGANAEQVFLRPLYRWIDASFGVDYRAATNQTLAPQEVKDLVQFLATRLSDALLFIAALHRLHAQLAGPNNHPVKLQRMRALADILVVFESNLRSWQRGVHGQLRNRTVALARENPAVAREFNTLDQHYGTSGIKLDTTSGLNRMLLREEARFSSVGTTAERAGIALFVAYRLRNSVMHVLDERLRVFKVRKALLKAVGLSLAAVRIAMCGKMGTLGSL